MLSAHPGGDPSADDRLDLGRQFSWPAGLAARALTIARPARRRSPRITFPPVHVAIFAAAHRTRRLIRVVDVVRSRARVDRSFLVQHDALAPASIAFGSRR